MRPPEFTGGKGGDAALPRRHSAPASMRPPEFTGGKTKQPQDHQGQGIVASMRPPEFTGGKPPMATKCHPESNTLQ